MEPYQVACLCGVHEARALLKAVRQVLHGVEQDFLVPRLVAQREEGIDVTPKAIFRGEDKRGDEITRAFGGGHWG